MNHIAFAISGGLNFGLIYVLLYLIRERIRTKNLLLRKSRDYDLLKWETKEYKKGIERFRSVMIENATSEFGRAKMRALDEDEWRILEHAFNTNFSDVPTTLDESTANEQQPHN